MALVDYWNRKEVRAEGEEESDMEEELFRWTFVVIFAATFFISGYFRHKARRSGSRIERENEGRHILLLRSLVAIPFYLSLVVYIINPEWMNWSSIPLPDWMRWSGAAAGVVALPLLYWTVKSLGRNISETFLTKKDHSLVTRGPYRRVRHPLYSVSTIIFVSLGLVAANWFILAMSLLIIALIVFFILPREEAQLKEKFGAQYGEYIKHTGRLTPRIRSFV